MCKTSSTALGTRIARKSITRIVGFIWSLKERIYMVNNVNPSASRLLEQIKRLSAQEAKKEVNHIDFKNDVMNNCTNNVSALKRANLLNNIEKIQKKNDIPIQVSENAKNPTPGYNVQISEGSKAIHSKNNSRKEPIGSFLDIYV